MLVAHSACGAGPQGAPQQQPDAPRTHPLQNSMLPPSSASLRDLSRGPITGRPAPSSSTPPNLAPATLDERMRHSMQDDHLRHSMQDEHLRHSMQDEHLRHSMQDDACRGCNASWACLAASSLACRPLLRLAAAESIRTFPLRSNSAACACAAYAQQKITIESSLWAWKPSRREWCLSVRVLSPRHPPAPAVVKHTQRHTFSSHFILHRTPLGFDLLLVLSCRLGAAMLNRRSGEPFRTFVRCCNSVRFASIFSPQQLTLMLTSHQLAQLAHR